MENSTTFETSNLTDLKFGFQLLGDYARFISNALSPESAAEAQKAKAFIALFDEMYTKSGNALSGTKLADLNRQAFQDVQDFRKYALQVLRGQISKTIIISLDPQTLNMMVNTAELLLDGLGAYMRNTFPDTSHLTSTWLQNIYTSTLLIQDRLGILFYGAREKAGEFANTFLHLYNKSLMLDGMRRTGLDKIAPFGHFCKEIKSQLTSYAEYLVDLISLITNNEYIGLLTLLEVDSIYRRVCFFLTKLAQISEIKAPACDPTAPRRE